MKDSTSRERKSAAVGKLVPNGHKGRSQFGCFGNHVNSLNIKKKEK